ncbi:jg5710 [Pararge aegeria aegeria]|uniref:Jg5710 protein n=1 Tax=Pararge aegeria aegeria TaxID=348720 RepID=A0A8S4SAZ7_9NEOP|nr:jg5710 [Pararge aegeria aegeria]
MPRLFRDGFFPEGAEQARFVWTEEDGNIASLISEPGFGTTGQTSFGKDLDAALCKEMKEANTLSICESKNGLIFERKTYVEPSLVSSTSADGPSSSGRDFQHQYTLMRHLPTHTDERNFHCDACSKSFRQLSTLSQHRAIHSAERPYSCEVIHTVRSPSIKRLHSLGAQNKADTWKKIPLHIGWNKVKSKAPVHAHPDDNSANSVVGRNRTTPLVAPPPAPPAPEMKLENSTSTQSEQCEVTSSVGPYLRPIERASYNQPQWEINEDQGELWNEGLWGSNGVIVDAIKTYHMGVAIATRQTPFALLKSDNEAPVLVKVVDAKLPGGKQMLVPATAEDLRVGGKIIVGNDKISNEPPEVDVKSTPDASGAVQIRVPVVATVVPKIRPGGRLLLSVEEPHYEYLTAMPSNGGKVKVGPCSSNSCSSSSIPATLPRLEPLKRVEVSGFDVPGREPNLRPGLCAMPPPAPSPPLDFISLDLFESMGTLPLGPQITTVDSIDQSPPSEDSDVFIGKFEESIPLSDSD